jgi:hypothetical protein
VFARKMHVRHLTACGLLHDVNDDTNQSRENIATIHDTLITHITLHLVYILMCAQQILSFETLLVRQSTENQILRLSKKERRCCYYCGYVYPLLATVALIWSTTDGSASVLRSPS